MKNIKDFMSWQAPTDGKTSVISFHSLFRRGPVEVVFLDLPLRLILLRITHPQIMDKVSL